jgi:hypothetical protein
MVSMNKDIATFDNKNYEEMLEAVQSGFRVTYMLMPNYKVLMKTYLYSHGFSSFEFLSESASAYFEILERESNIHFPLSLVDIKRICEEAAGAKSFCRAGNNIKSK